MSSKCISLSGSMTDARLWIFMILGLVAVALLLGGCGQQETAEDADRTVSVKGLVVTSSDRELVSSYTGSLEGERQAKLYSKLAESIDSVWVREGDRVKRDQVVVSLDPDAPSSGFREARSQFLNSEKNFGKMKVLYEQGAISEMAFDDAKTLYEVAEANYESIRRLIRVESPIAGTVTEITVSPGDFVNIGHELATVATIGRLRVRFGVNSSEISFFEQGGTVKIKSDAVAGEAIGEIISIASSADLQTRAFEVEALVDNSEQHFQPGMFVRIDYILEELPDVIAIPRSSVVILDDQPTVFTAVGGVAQLNRVTLGADLRGDVVVTSGLQVGDTVITVGQSYVEDATELTMTEVREQNL